MRTTQEQANLDLVMGLFENVLQPLDSTHVDKYISPNYIQHSPMAAPGVQSLKNFLDFVHKRSPEAKQYMYRSFADGDYVVLHYHVVRHPGDNGLAVVDIFRCENGMVAEHWDSVQEVKTDGPNPNSMFELGGALMRFAGKTALVVGGNSGIGLAAAKGLAAEGAQVFVTGRSAETLAKTEADIAGARAFQADMADPASIDPVLDAIRSATGKLDVLMVNAGVGIFSPISAVTPDLWDSVHDVNLRGAFFTAQKAVPLMGKGGSIVFTGSIGAVLAMPGNVIYAAAKAGLIAVMKTFARELVEQGIRVNMISPGPVETPIITRSGLDEAGITAMRARMTSVVPMGRMGEPEEAAAAMLFLASDEASFITGVDLFVDGGRVSLR